VTADACLGAACTLLEGVAGTDNALVHDGKCTFDVALSNLPWFGGSRRTGLELAYVRVERNSIVTFVPGFFLP
jgi:hypothetical protein